MKKALVLKNFPRNFTGFSLIEVLVFVSILALFFVAALAVVTFSLKTMKTSEHKILASHYAEEGMEWVKGQKEDDWTTFVALDGLEGRATYCINDLNFGNPSTCGQTYGLGTPAIFAREVWLENVPDSANPDTVRVTIMVYWKESGNDFNAFSRTVLKRLE